MAVAQPRDALQGFRHSAPSPKDTPGRVSPSCGTQSGTTSEKSCGSRPEAPWTPTREKEDVPCVNKQNMGQHPGPAAVPWEESSMEMLSGEGTSHEAKGGQVGDRQAANLWRHCPRKQLVFPGWVTAVLPPSPQVAPERVPRSQGDQTCPPSSFSRTGSMSDPIPHPTVSHAPRTDVQDR